MHQAFVTRLVPRDAKLVNFGFLVLDILGKPLLIRKKFINQLDELELTFSQPPFGEIDLVVGKIGRTRQGQGDANQAERHIFGLVLLNDWSARDVQAFEYRPLGPFLGKSFATSVSPWVVPLAALDAARVQGPVQDPEPAAYLKATEPRNIDVRLQLSVNGTVISEMSSADLYWSPAQMLAHLTANGAGVRVGDLFGTGTISGPGPGSEGSLAEAWGGERWLEDGDRVTIAGWCGDEAIGAVEAEVRAA